MKKISISYNPYFVTTDIKVDGQVPPAGTGYVQLTKGTRLLNWVAPFLNKIFQQYRCSDLAFEFFGTKQDAEDFRQAIAVFNAAAPARHFHLDDIHVSEIGNNPIESLKKLYDDGKRGPFAEIFESEKMKAAFGRATSPEFEVNVIATMSSGKSTLINALLGKNIMPSKNEACTATIASIEDCDDQPIFTAVRYDANGKLLTKKPEQVTRKLLTSWNDDALTSRIEIKGNIPTVDETQDSKYVFIDTPGPNNSRNDEHKKTTFEAIESKPLSMIIYVLNATNFGVNDDDALLRKVAKTMNAGGRQAQDRFIFVVNKVDQFRRDDDSVSSTLGNVRKYLNDHGIDNPLIIPVSALLAKLLRLKKLSPQEFSRDDEDDLEYMITKFTGNPDLNLYEHCKGSLNQEVIRRIDARLAHASEEERILIYTGLPVLEELLNDFLYRHAIPAKMKDAVDSFASVLRHYQEEQNLANILKQSDEEIRKAAEAIKNFSSGKENLAKTEDFKRKIQAITFSYSAGTEQKLTEINEEKELVLEKLERRLKRDNVSEYEARELCDKAGDDCRIFEIDVQTTLKKALKEECFFQMDDLRAKYKTYITEVLKTAFPENPAVRDLETAVFEMPDTEELITDNTKTEYYEVKVERSRWNPLRWFGSKYTTEERERDVVVISKIYSEVVDAVRDFAQENLRKFKKQASEALEESKKQLIKLMNDKQAEMETLEQQLASAGKNKEEKEAKKREIEAKIAWYNEFQTKLQKILAI